jgi:hypothetical protein
MQTFLTLSESLAALLVWIPLQLSFAMAHGIRLWLILPFPIHVMPSTGFLTRVLET